MQELARTLGHPIPQQAGIREEHDLTLPTPSVPLITNYPDQYCSPA